MDPDPAVQTSFLNGLNIYAKYIGASEKRNETVKELFKKSEKEVVRAEVQKLQIS